MPTPTYIPLANLTLTGSASSVTFSSISQAYRDLVLVVSATSSAATNTYIRFNADSGTNYHAVYMEGDGSATSSGTKLTAAQIQSTNSFADISTSPNTQVWSVMDYSATDKHKSVLLRTNLASGGVGAVAARWANTAAITTLLVVGNGGTLSSGTTLALYGIAS